MSEFWKLKKKITCFKANDEKKISKIFTTNADCVILDIEDGVALNRKQQARENIRKLYETNERVQTNLKNKYTVRINAPASNEAKQDILYLFENKKVPKTLFVPKTNSSDDIKWLFDQLNVQVEASNSQIDKLSLFFYMESASSLVASELTTDSLFCFSFTFSSFSSFVNNNNNHHYNHHHHNQNENRKFPIKIQESRKTLIGPGIIRQQTNGESYCWINFFFAFFPINFKAEFIDQNKDLIQFS